MSDSQKLVAEVPNKLVIALDIAAKREMTNRSALIRRGILKIVEENGIEI